MCYNVQAQESHTDTRTKIYLHNGSKWIGQIQSIDSANLYHVLTSSGLSLTIPESNIRKIEQELVHSKRNKEYNFKEKGWYQITNVAQLVGRDVDNEKIYGYAVLTTAGYLFHRYFGVGIQSGYLSYSGSYDNVIPLMGEVRSYVYGQNIAYYFAYATGYNFALKDNSLGILKAKGGWSQYPSLGIRWSGKKHFNITTDVGCIFQNGHYQIASWGDTLNDYDRIYKRLIFRIGIQI